MKRSICWIALIFLCLAMPARAQINGLHEMPRVFNDFSGSTLTITNGNSVNQGAGVSQATIFDTNRTHQLVVVPTATMCCSPRMLVCPPTFLASTIPLRSRPRSRCKLERIHRTKRRGCGSTAP